MPVVDVDGLRVGYDRRGSGPPLVLLHGGLCDRRVWRAEADDLADGFAVVAWDAPGCGESSDPPEDFSLRDYARCLRGALDALGVSRPHVVGHSWGAGLALQLAADFPDVPASLVLVGGYAGWGGSLPADEVERRRASADAVVEQLPDHWDPRSVPGLLSDRLPADRADELVGIMSAIRPRATRVMARGFAEADLREDLPRVAVPTLLLNGTADERAPRAVAEALHALLPRSALVLAPGLGHELAQEDSHLFTTAVRSFVGGVTTASGLGAGR